MDFDTAYRRYDWHLMNVETLAYATRRGYRERADAIAAYMIGHGYRDTDQITADLMADFMVNTYAKLADGTYNLYVSQARRYLKFLREEGLLAADQAPERKLKPRRRPQPRRTKNYVHVEEVDGYALKAREWHVRDEYIVRILSGFARRATELCTMDVGDVDLNPRGNAQWGIFRFTNVKTGKTKFLPIQEHVAPYLRRWLEIYADLHGGELQPEYPLFPALQKGRGRAFRSMRDHLVINVNKRLTYGSLYDALGRAGVPDTHSLRRGMVTDLKKRHGIRVAMKYADHGSEQMTERYIDEDREVDDLAILLSKEAAARQEAQETPEAAMPAGVVSLADRRGRSAGARQGA